MKRSAEAKAKTSATLKRHVRTPEHCANISAGRQGIKFSEAHRANLSAAHLGQRRPLSPATRQKIGQLAAERYRQNPQAWQRPRNANGSFGREAAQ